jgi:hypothetical protein
MQLKGIARKLHKKIIHGKQDIFCYCWEIRFQFLCRSPLPNHSTPRWVLLTRPIMGWLKEMQACFFAERRWNNKEEGKKLN